MSAYGTKRTYRVALHMSAFRGRADMRPLSRSLPPVSVGMFMRGPDYFPNWIFRNHGRFLSLANRS